MKIKALFFLIAIAGISWQGCGERGDGPTIPPTDSTGLFGLQKEIISVISIDPANPNTVYAGSISDFSAGTVGCLFKTVDGGYSWNKLRTGASDKYRSIAIDPSNPETIYAGPWGIIMSLDGGRTWQEKDRGILVDPEHRVLAILLDPLNPSTLYAGTGGPFGGYLYKTIDAGGSWIRVGDSLVDGILSLAMDPTNTSIVYAGTAGRGILWKTTDAGGHWARMGLGETSLGIETIVIDPVRPSTLLVGLSPNYGPITVFPFYGIERSDDGGATWQGLSQGLVEGIGVMKIVTRINEGTIYILCAAADTQSASHIDTVSGIYYRGASDLQWKKAALDSLSDLFYADMKLSNDGKTLYVGGKGISKFILK
jgi:photosystem II stability/assembly factor-like uncharacterized protein